MASEPVQEYPAEVVRGTFFEHDIPVSKIFVHFRTEPDGYARPLRQWRVNKLVAEFDRQALGVLLLSMRDDGRFAAIDGQHRWEAAKRLGIETVDALVYIDLSTEDEARLYRKFGDYLRQTALDKYHAAVTERVPEYLAIQRILGALGLHVPQTLGSANHTVDAVDALIRVTRTYGLDGLNNTLNLISDAWDGEHRCYRSMILMGTAAFLARYQDHPNYHRKRLVSRMNKQGMNAIERQAYVIRDANLAPNPNSGWGQALLQLHDRRQPPGTELGDWPKRLMTEQAAAASAANIRKVSASLTPQQKSAMSIKASETRSGTPSPRTVACSYCHANVGNMCISNTNNVLPNYHNVRRAAVGKGPKK